MAAIASHRVPLKQAEVYLDHLTSCSPCYREFLQLRDTSRRRHRMGIFLVSAAAILTVAALAIWAEMYGHSRPQLVQNVVLDLRNRSISRGVQPTDTEPIELLRHPSHLEIYLPLGSSEGEYQLHITDDKGRPMFSGTGTARTKGGVTALSVDVNLSSANPGLYTLQVQKVGAAWTSYPLRMR